MSAKRKAKVRAKPAKKKAIPTATTIGMNPLDEVMSKAAVVSAIYGLIAGERAERKAATSAAKNRRKKRK